MKSIRLTHIAAIGVCLMVFPCDRAFSAAPSTDETAATFSQAEWRRSPDDFRLDEAFPLAIGAEVVAVPSDMSGSLPEQPEPNVADAAACPTRETSALLSVYVPCHAKVTLNGHPTSSKGSRRRYVACGLKPDLSYKYVIEAQWVDNGRIVEDRETVVVSAGTDGAAALALNPALEEAINDWDVDALPMIPESGPLDFDSLPGVPESVPLELDPLPEIPQFEPSREDEPPSLPGLEPEAE